MERGKGSAGGRLKYTWGDAVLTLLGMVSTLYTAAKADDVADKGGSTVPFWVAYAAGAVAAICWWVFYSRNPAAVRRSRAGEGRRRVVIISAAPLLGLVGYALVQFAAEEVKAVIFGLCAGFLLAAMLGYGAYVLCQRRRSSA